MLPILNIYRKYHGLTVSLFLLATFFVAMVLAALAVEFLFAAIDLTPEARDAEVVEASVTWNYTTVLNIVLLVLAAVLVWRAGRTGGFRMLRTMNRPMPAHAAGEHA